LTRSRSRRRSTSEETGRGAPKEKKSSPKAGGKINRLFPSGVKYEKRSVCGEELGAQRRAAGAHEIWKNGIGQNAKKRRAVRR